MTLTRFSKNSKNSNFLLIRKFTKNIDSSYARTDFLVSWKTYTRTQTHFFEVQKTRTRTRTRFWKFPKNSNFWLTQFSVIWKKLELFKKLAKSFFDSLNRFLMVVMSCRLISVLTHSSFFWKCVKTRVINATVYNERTHNEKKNKITM